MVRSNGTLSKAFTTENHQSDSVSWPSVNKLFGNALCSFDTVRFKIFCKHTCGDIKRHHDIDSFSCYILSAGTCLRASYGYNNCSTSQCPKDKRQMMQSL